MASQYNFWCNNRSNCSQCEFCDRKGDVVIKIETHEENETFICPNNEEIQLKKMGQKMYGKTTPVMNSDQIKKEKRARSLDHFKKNELPNLPLEDRKMFARKGVLPK